MLTRAEVEAMLADGVWFSPRHEELARDWLAMEAALSPIATLLRVCPGIRVVIPSGSPMAEQITAAALAKNGGK